VKRIRIATERATGARYVVQQVDFRAEQVHCWGGVVAARGASTRHNGSLSFPLAAVALGEVDKTEALALELFREHAERLVAAGDVSKRRNRNGRLVYEYRRPA
jgi:hypothetical protein